MLFKGIRREAFRHWCLIDAYYPTKLKDQWSRSGVRTKQEAALSKRKMYAPGCVSNTFCSSISLMETAVTEVVSRFPHSRTDTLGSSLGGPLVLEALGRVS